MLLRETERAEFEPLSYLVQKTWKCSVLSNRAITKEQVGQILSRLTWAKRYEFQLRLCKGTKWPWESHLILAGPHPHPQIKRQNHSLHVFSFFPPRRAGHGFLSLCEALIRHDHSEAMRKTTSFLESVPLLITMASWQLMFQISLVTEFMGLRVLQLSFLAPANSVTLVFRTSFIPQDIMESDITTIV